MNDDSDNEPKKQTLLKLAAAMGNDSNSSNFDKRYSSKTLRRKSVEMAIQMESGGGSELYKQISVVDELDKSKSISNLMNIIMCGLLIDENENEKKKDDKNENENENEENKLDALKGKDTKEEKAASKATFLWCNGKCGGNVDTEFCTELCIKVWEDKMKLHECGRNSSTKNNNYSVSRLIMPNRRVAAHSVICRNVA